MWKAAGAFRSIGEVADLIGVAPHVLRYWETQFSQLKPMKRPDGRRYYRPDDVRLAAGLCEVLREEGLTIRGAKKMMAKDRGEAVRRRGDTRLGEVMGSGLAAAAPDAPPAAAPSHPATSETGRAGSRGVGSRGVGPQAEFSDPLDDDGAEDQPSHPPRARHRRRPHGPSETCAAADGADHACATTLLPRLVKLASGLRELREWPSDGAPARAAIQILRDRIGSTSENSLN